MTRNKYVDISIQKERVSGFSGYIEDTSIISQLFPEAKQKDITVVWLDLANAYGIISHVLIQELS